MKELAKQAAKLAAAICFAVSTETAFAAVPLSLSESVDMALSRDESIAAAEARKGTAKWQLSAARRAQGFNIGWRSNVRRIGGADYQEQRAWYRLGQTDDAYDRSFTNSVSAEFPLYTGGRIENTIEARHHGLSAADLALENAKQTVKYQTVEAYYNVLQQKNLVDVARSAVQTSDKQLALISAQFSEGAVARSDVLQMQVQLANYRQNLVTAEGALAVAKRTLLTYVGLPRETDIEMTDAFSYTPFVMELPDCIVLF